MQCKVLVVDDEISVCKALRKFLEDKDYEVVEAYDGNEALAAYKQESPDIVLLDIRMPGKDGLETFREIRGFDPEASVIMVTAVRDSEVALQAMEEGAFEYITKPINPDYLELVIETKLTLSGGCK